MNTNGHTDPPFMPDLKEFFARFRLETIGLAVFMLAAPVCAWQFPRTDPAMKPMCFAACTCILAATVFLSVIVFRQGPRVSEVTPPPVLLPIQGYPPATR